MRKVVAAASSTLGYLILVGQAYAQTPRPFLEAPTGSVDATTQVESIPQLVINLLFGVAIFLAVAYLLYGGIKYITSKGNTQQVEAARKHIIAAVIGIVVVAGTFFIMQTVFTVLGADNPISQGFQLPTLKNVRPSATP